MGDSIKQNINHQERVLIWPFRLWKKFCSGHSDESRPDYRHFRLCSDLNIQTVVELASDFQTLGSALIRACRLCGRVAVYPACANLVGLIREWITHLSLGKETIPLLNSVAHITKGERSTCFLSIAYTVYFSADYGYIRFTGYFWPLLIFYRPVSLSSSRWQRIVRKKYTEIMKEKL